MISSPVDRKKIRDALEEASACMLRISAERDLIKEIAKEVSENFEIPKKQVNKMIRVYHKQSFNEEIAVRAAADSQIPLIAAVGHETDWTLIDFVADLRAPTPTGAAEKAVPVRAELIEHLASRARRLTAATSRAMHERHNRLISLARVLPAPANLLATPRQRLDRAGERLTTSLRTRQDAQRLRLARAARARVPYRGYAAERNPADDRAVDARDRAVHQRDDRDRHQRVVRARDLAAN